jgi:hypothetical protein
MNERWMIIHIIRGRDSLRVLSSIILSISLLVDSGAVFCVIGKIDSKILTHLETLSTRRGPLLDMRKNIKALAR